MVGASFVVTLTVCEQDAVRSSEVVNVPLSSVAVQVITVVPTGYGSFTGRSSFRTPVTVRLLPVADGVVTVTVASV
jgi:hypothetical protein